MAIAIPATPASSRLQFIDNIRWTMIVLVVFHHSAVTYSHVGSWFYNESPRPELWPTLLMATFLSFNQAYFMGFLFFIAGYFAAPSFDRKGFRKFIRDRLVRLGLPSLLFILVIYPWIVYWLLRVFYQPDRPTVRAAYPSFLLSGRFLSASGPMWFAIALLIFCLVYGAVRSLIPKQPHPVVTAAGSTVPGHRHVAAVIIALTGATFFVRIFQPVGTSVLNMQLCYFAQYILLFSLGILFYRRNWLMSIPFRFGIVWFTLALTAGLVLWVLVLASAGVLSGHEPTAIFGGLHWQSLLNCFWESLVCAGISLGVLVLFRDHVHAQDATSSFMSRNAFSAYLFHTPLLIVVTLALHRWSAPALLKFPVAGAIAVIVTFSLSEYVFRRTPFLRQIL
jgi:glucan biosynthesis protein C